MDTKETSEEKNARTLKNMQMWTKQSLDLILEIKNGLEEIEELATRDQADIDGIKQEVIKLQDAARDLLGRIFAFDDLTSFFEKALGIDHVEIQDCWSIDEPTGKEGTDDTTKGMDSEDGRSGNLASVAQ